jgi:hypothetical protein
MTFGYVGGKPEANNEVRYGVKVVNDVWIVKPSIVGTRRG